MNAETEQNCRPVREEPPASDVALLRQYTGHGDREALGQLFSRHADQAFRTACRIMRNPTDAEDAVQSAFVRIMRDAAGYRGGEGVRMWIIQVVMSACRDAIRKNIRRRQHEDESAENMEEPGNTDDAAEMGNLVKRLLNVLPERYRMPVWLHHSEGLSFHDVALALAVPEGTARSYATRGVDMLKERLGRAGAVVPVSGIVAALVAFPAEHASAGLVARLVDLAIKGVDATGGGAFAGGPGATAAWKWPAIVGGGAALVASLVAVNAFRPELPAPPAVAPSLPPPPAAVAPAATTVRYYWDLNAPGLPPEFKVVSGAWSHLADGGVDNSGCIRFPGPLSIFLIDIPMDRLPVVLSYRTSPELIRGNAGQTKVGWSEYLSAAEFNGLDAAYHIPTAAKEGGRAFWVIHREYVAETFVYRWHDQGIKDLCVFERAPNARLVLGVVGPQILDDILIESIRPEDIPDAAPYLKALDGIPLEKRTGAVPLPQFKPAHPDVKQVLVRFDGPFSFLKWAKAQGN